MLNPDAEQFAHCLFRGKACCIGSNSTGAVSDFVVSIDASRKSLPIRCDRIADARNLNQINSGA
jgi:hypothetical protein